MNTYPVNNGFPMQMSSVVGSDIARVRISHRARRRMLLETDATAHLRFPSCLATV